MKGYSPRKGRAADLALRCLADRKRRPTVRIVSRAGVLWKEGRQLWQSYLLCVFLLQELPAWEETSALPCCVPHTGWPSSVHTSRALPGGFLVPSLLRPPLVSWGLKQRGQTETSSVNPWAQNLPHSAQPLRQLSQRHSSATSSLCKACAGPLAALSPSLIICS